MIVMLTPKGWTATDNVLVILTLLAEIGDRLTDTATHSLNPSID
jgi:hypothetical protein